MVKYGDWAKGTQLQNALVKVAAEHGAPAYLFNIPRVSLQNQASFHVLFDTQGASDHVNVNAADDSNYALLVVLADALIAHAASPHPVSDIKLSAHQDHILSSNGYNATDLQAWLTILASTDSAHAASLFVQTDSQPANSIPCFVYAHFLSRAHMTAASLRLAIQYMPIWLAEYRRGHHTPDMTLLLFRVSVRLLHHAAKIWPEAIPHIAHSFIAALRLEYHQSPPSLQHLTKLTTLLNRFLYLLSEPCAVEPFKSAAYQESAQAIVLRYMADHEPPFHIAREGYRGVVRVQLAHRKTPDEIAWANLKSPSWPPWKEDRTGMDALVGLDYGISRARHVLHRMQEAGYAMKTWERAALIYSGWDTDLSPTIQTRTLLPGIRSGSPADAHIWAARVESTRTVHEAWACFLSYEDASLPPDQRVYLAMFRKLVQEDKRHRFGDLGLPTFAENEHDPDSIYPGDVKEVFPPPASAHQATYTRTPPPSVVDLHAHMMDRGLPPAGTTLALLLDQASTLSEGLVYLASAESGSEELSAPLDSLNFGSMPDVVFAAVIKLLARFPRTRLRDEHKDTIRYGNGVVKLRQPLAMAAYLLERERRQYRPAWNALLGAYARREAPVIFTNWVNSHRDERQASDSPQYDSEREALDKLAAYNNVKHALSLMHEIDIPLDVVGFRFFCIVVEHAARAASEIIVKYKPIELGTAIPMPDVPENPRRRRHYFKAYNQARDLQKEYEQLRHHFWALVGDRSGVGHDQELDHETESALPRLLTIPPHAVLHAYIRALGFLKDYEGLRELANWMKTYDAELNTRLEIDRNGTVMLRRCIIALRVFLEDRWKVGSEVEHGGQSGEVPEEPDSGECDHSSTIGAPKECLDAVREIVENTDWHGWPTEEEVEEYMKRM